MLKFLISANRSVPPLVYICVTPIYSLNHVLYVFITYKLLGCLVSVRGGNGAGRDNGRGIIHVTNVDREGLVYGTVTLYIDLSSQHPPY